MNFEERSKELSSIKLNRAAYDHMLAREAALIELARKQTKLLIMAVRALRYEGADLGCDHDKSICHCQSIAVIKSINTLLDRLGEK